MPKKQTITETRTTSAATPTDILRPLIEKRRKVYHWGQPHMVTPRLVTTVFGDGKQLIGLAPMMYRPHYFVVRIDSSWNISNYAHDCELLIDHMDEIYDAIEDEFYEWPWARKYGLRCGRACEDNHYGDNCARVCFGDGSCWWIEEWPDGSSSI